MSKEKVRNLAGILLFYFVMVAGVIAINARMEYVNGTSAVSTFSN